MFGLVGNGGGGPAIGRPAFDGALLDGCAGTDVGGDNDGTSSLMFSKVPAREGTFIGMPSCKSCDDGGVLTTTSVAEVVEVGRCGAARRGKLVTWDKRCRAPSASGGGPPDDVVDGCTRGRAVDDIGWGWFESSSYVSIIWLESWVAGEGRLPSVHCFDE